MDLSVSSFGILYKLKTDGYDQDRGFGYLTGVMIKEVSERGTGEGFPMCKGTEVWKGPRCWWTKAGWNGWSTEHE